MLGAAVHGAWCGTKTFPTVCPSCGIGVFFFSCNCGCKVFFDDLGAPWPIHDCDTSWTRGLRRTTDSTGSISVELSPGVTITRPPESFGIESSIVESARAGRRRAVSAPIDAIEPKSSRATEVIGVLRELSRNAKPLKTYRLDDTVMAFAMLGPIGMQAMGRITIHVPSAAAEKLESYTAWIPADLVRDSRITRGIAVSATLVGVAIPTNGYAWYCDCFEVMG